jgi:tRNA-specific adenosine deaminase 2
MFRTVRTEFPQQQALWTPLVVASMALGLALYFLRNLQPSSSAVDPSQVDEEQPCQASDANHQSDAMNAEEKAYHERFMREAIAMVSQLHRSHSSNMTDSSR